MGNNKKITFDKNLFMIIYKMTLLPIRLKLVGYTEVLIGVPAVGGFQPGLKVEGITSWGMSQLGDLNLFDSPGTIFILIHLYLVDATNKIFSLSTKYAKSGYYINNVKITKNRASRRRHRGS